MDETRTFKIGRNRRLKFTQRTRYRLSKSDFDARDFEDPQKILAGLCVFLHALVDESNFDMSLEDIAVEIEGREEQAIKLVSELMAPVTEAAEAAEAAEDGEDGEDAEKKTSG